MSDISQVTNLLAVASETFSDNLSASIAANATTILVNSAAEYNDGDAVVITVEPGTINEATFTGTKQGNSFVNCKWTEGNVEVGHAAGSLVIDYVSATHYNMLRKAVQNVSVENNAVVTQLGLIQDPDGEYKKLPLINALYPIGSIYINATVNTNPAILLGAGTWVAFGAGRVPVGVDSTQVEFDTLGETGGAKTHTLTEAQLASHRHEANTNGAGGHAHNTAQIYSTFGGARNRSSLGAGSDILFGATTTDGVGDHAHYLETNFHGGNQPHNNLQPYITVYMWRRTA